ncbi:MAG: riboflavin biosynthesis protein RibF, partial [Ferruginibacter sp.]
LEKYRLFEKHGIEHIVEVPFNRDFADQLAKDYISEFLVNNFHPHTIIIGYDHKFGRNREGDYNLLEAEAKKNNYIVKEIPEQVIKEITISSTAIRKALNCGEVKKANEFLGYNYELTGIVVQGDKRGRTIGFPTANIQVLDKSKLIPANGVYLVSVKVENVYFKGMMNIGTRPTFNGISNSIEVYILDFNEDIYGKQITVEFEKWLRAEMKFGNINELKTQLNIDLNNARISE